MTQKRKQSKQTIPIRKLTTKKSEPNYIARTLLTNTKNDTKEKESRNPFLTKSYYSQEEKQEKTENISNLDINKNDNNIVKSFDSLSSIKVDLPQDFSQITPKQAPSSYSKPFAMFDSLFPIVKCSKKKEGLYTFPFKDDKMKISTELFFSIFYYFSLIISNIHKF